MTTATPTRIEIHADVFNAVFLPLLDDRNRYLVLYGGAGSGKSVFAAQKVIYRVLSEPDHRFLVTRKVGLTIRHSAFQLLRDIIAEWGLSGLFKINKSDMEITCVNGGQILFSGLDDVEKLKSITRITGIWVEEASELEDTDLRQLNLRLRGRTPSYKQIILSFNPVDITSWLYREFFGDNKRPNATVSHTTYKDNRFIDPEYAEELESLKNRDPYYYDVYCLGRWGVVGRTFFSMQIIRELMGKVETGDRGYLVEDEDNTVRFVPDRDGWLTVYRYPEKEHAYAIGADVAEGLEHGDYCCAEVIDRDTGEQAAEWHGHIDPDLFGIELVRLARWYNRAWVGPEVNNHGLTTAKTIARLGYRRILHRMNTMEEEDREIEPTDKLGWRTDVRTRPIMLDDLARAMRERSIRPYSQPFLAECQTFVRNEKGKPEAQTGCFDDRVMAMAIAVQVHQLCPLGRSTGEVPDIPPTDPYTGY